MLANVPTAISPPVKAGTCDRGTKLVGHFSAAFLIVAAAASLSNRPIFKTSKAFSSGRTIVVPIEYMPIPQMAIGESE